MAAQTKQEKLSTLVSMLQLGSLFLFMETLLPGMLQREIGDPVGYIVYYAAFALIACGVIGFMGIWRETGFRHPDSLRALWWFSPLLIVGLYQTRWHVYADFGATATYALYYLAQSVQARAIFDGLMVRSLLPLGRWTAAIVPAICQAALIGFEFALVPLSQDLARCCSLSWRLSWPCLSPTRRSAYEQGWSGHSS